MRKILTITTLLILGGVCLSVHAQSQKDEFLDSLLISEDYQKEYQRLDKGLAASQDAREKLQQEKKKIDIEQNRKLRDIIRKQQAENKNKATVKQDIKRISQLSPAPFGLLWGETYEETLSSGVILTHTQEKDYVNSFVATQLTKPVKDIRHVVVTFGEENKLWRIIAYGQQIKDTPDASLILKEYHRFYDMLAKKYGHDEEVYNPQISKIKKTVDLGHGKTKEEIEEIEEPIGNPQFLSQLQSGNADLYATFYNDEVGAALSVNVDGNGNSYLILEYKNLKIFQAQQDKTLDAL